GKLDLWSYYLDGVETYREWYVNTRDEPNQMHYRWMNAGGTKYGIDLNNDGKIGAWKMISDEEIRQEVLQAVAKRDLERLRALMISETEIKLLGLPAAETNRIREAQKQAPTKFQATVAKLTSVNDKTHWLHLETMAPPQCLPAEQTGLKYDLIKSMGATILFETNGQNDWLQTGEMIQVGLAWRLVNAPSPGSASVVPPGANVADDKELQPLLEELKKIDDKLTAVAGGAGANPEVVKLQLGRADVLEKIVAKVQPEQRDIWIRQVADCLQGAAQSSPKDDKTAYQRLQRLEKQVVEAPGQAGGNLAAYVTYREM